MNPRNGQACAQTSPRAPLPAAERPSELNTGDAPERTDDVERQLVATLYGQRSVLVAGHVALCIVAVASWFQTGERCFLVWLTAIAAIFSLRLYFEGFFYRSGSEKTPVRVWRLVHRAGSWATGALLGCAALVIINAIHPLVQLLVLTTEMVFIMGGAARNAGSTCTAKGQILLGILPVFAACLWTRDAHYVLFSFAIIFQLSASFSLVHYLHERLVRLLVLNAENSALVAAVQRANGELTDANRRLAEAAFTDALTGIANRRRFDDFLSAETRRAQRAGDGLALLLIDVDHFKRFNDHYGHQAGDTCLRSVAAVVAQVGGRGRLAARYGGEEFVVVLPGLDAISALAAADGLRSGIAALGIPHALTAEGIVTVSVGVAAGSPALWDRPEDIVRAADEALYAAKGTGRNCVRCAPPSAFGAGADEDPRRRAFVATESPSAP